jgi:hypothetical protein
LQTLRLLSAVLATGGPVFIPDAGYWHEAANSSTLQRCPNGGACAGNRSAITACQRTLSCPTGDSYKTMQCSRGYRGNLCGSCRRDQGYARDRYFRCTKCLTPVANIALLLVFATAACALVVFVACRNWCDARPAANLSEQCACRTGGMAALDGAADALDSKLSLADVFKVLIVYLQYLGIIGNLLVDWPPAAAFLFEAAHAIFVTDSSRVMSLECFGIVGEGARMLLMLVVPLLVVGLACWVVVVLLGRKLVGRAGPLQHIRSASVDLLVSTALIGVFQFYSVLVATTLSAFACMEAAGKLFWVRDLDLQCWKGEHVRAPLALGLVGSLVLVVAVPAATVALLWSNMTHLQDPSFRRRYGFLYQPYKPQRCYWEGVVCLQTCALVYVDLFGRRMGTFYQLILMALVLLANSSLANTLRPFRSKHQMRLCVSSTTCLLMTCLGVLTLLKGYTTENGGGMSEAKRNAVAVMLLVINLASVTWCVVLMARAGMQVAKAGLPGAWSSRFMQQLKSRSRATIRSFLSCVSRASGNSDTCKEVASAEVPSGGTGVHRLPSSSAASPAAP